MGQIGLFFSLKHNFQTLIGISAGVLMTNKNGQTLFK